MIGHAEFATLRLSDFVDPAEIVQLADWEFEDRLWIGEAVGFTEWLRPQSSPERLGSIALDLAALPEHAAHACLARIGLPLRRGMTFAEIQSLLGEVVDQQSFSEDQTTFLFEHGSPDVYRIDCTVQADGGLVYLVVMALGCDSGESL